MHQMHRFSALIFTHTHINIFMTYIDKMCVYIFTKLNICTCIICSTKSTISWYHTCKNMFALAASVGLKARPPVKINHPCKARDLHRLPGCGEGRLVRWLVAPLHLRWSFGSKQMLPKHFTKISWESIACDRYKGSPIVISVFFC